MGVTCVRSSTRVSLPRYSSAMRAHWQALAQERDRLSRRTSSTGLSMIAGPRWKYTRDETKQDDANTILATRAAERIVNGRILQNREFPEARRPIQKARLA